MTHALLWSKIRANWVESVIRFFGGNELTGKKKRRHARCRGHVENLPVL